MSHLFPIYNNLFVAIISIILGVLTVYDGANITLVIVATIVFLALEYLMANQVLGKIQRKSIGVFFYTIITMLFSFIFFITINLTGVVASTAIETDSKSKTIALEQSRSGKELIKGIDPDFANSMFPSDEEHNRVDKNIISNRETAKAIKFITTEPSQLSWWIWVVISTFGSAILASVSSAIHLRFQKYKSKN